MLGCCEDALAAYKERPKDTNIMIVMVTLPGIPYHVYMRSDQWIINQFCSPIPIYVGPASKAPQEYYGKGTFEEDEWLMSLV